LREKVVMIKRIVVAAVASVVVALPLASPASAGLSRHGHHSPTGVVITQAIDWE
jgi:hypothetical protein